MTDPDDLVARLREGCIERPKRWTGDMHADLGGPIMADETDALMRDAAAEIERLRAELASGSFYKESDIDALQDEIERLRDLLGRLCVYVGECEGTDYIGDPEEHYHGFDMGIINQGDAKEIARYREAARAKMEGEG